MSSHSQSSVPIPYPTADSIRERLAQWQHEQHPTRPMSDDIAMAALTKGRRGMLPSDIEEKLSQLTMNGIPASPRYLASYPDLQALDRLEEATTGIDLSNNQQAANIRAVLQASEIALLNISDLARRACVDMRYGRVEDAEEKNRWINSFQETLESLGALLSTFPSQGEGTDISIDDSPHFHSCLKELQEFHTLIDNAGLTKPEHIGYSQLHQAGGNLSHQTFVDTTYIEMWEKTLGRIHIPGINADSKEEPEEFYKKFVGTDALHLAVHELDQTGDNFLRQFRGYHQMTEILTAQTNRVFCDTINLLLDPGTSPMQAQEYLMNAQENLDHSIKILDIVNANLKPIARNLSVSRYEDIRGSLGITSGSHSPNIRGALFAPLYELLIAAVEQRAMGFKEFTPEERANRLQEIVSQRNTDLESHALYGVLKDMQELHLHINAWRNAHLQFIKTQMGFGGEGEPTASISGAPNAYHSAKGFSSHASAHDPIGPIFKALTGKEFVPEFIKTPELPINSIMGANTQDIVRILSAGVQNRVHRK